MNVFLRLKHWQLFGLLIGIPFIFQIVGMTTVIVSQDPTKMFTVFPLLMLLFMGVFFGWFYAMGVNLNKKLPDTVKMNLTAQCNLTASETRKTIKNRKIWLYSVS